MRNELRKQLEKDEDRRRHVYKDSRGFWTIGVGRLVDDRFPSSGLREEEITFLFNNDVEERISQLTHALPWFQDLDDVRKGALLNMAFQLGIEGLLKFHCTLALMHTGKYTEASAEMMRSDWATQTPARAARMAKQVRTGEWQYAA